MAGVILTADWKGYSKGPTISLSHVSEVFILDFTQPKYLVFQFPVHVLSLKSSTLYKTMIKILACWNLFLQ